MAAKNFNSPASPHLHAFENDAMLINGKPMMPENIRSLAARFITRRFDDVRREGVLHIITHLICLINISSTGSLKNFDQTCANLGGK